MVIFFATVENFLLTGCRYFLKKRKLPVRTKIVLFVAGIFLVVIFLFSCDILVECASALPIDLWLFLFFFVVWGPRVVKSKKHKVSDSHPSLMGNYHKSYLHISAIIFGWMAKVLSRRFTKNDVINGRLITTNSVLKQSIEQRNGKTVILHRYDPRDEDSYQHFHQKKSECTILANLSVFEIVFATSIVLYHHCCAALSCIATLLLFCNLCCVCL